MFGLLVLPRSCPCCPRALWPWHTPTVRVLPHAHAFAPKLSSLYHGCWPERCVLVPVCFVEHLETYKRLPCHCCPQPASGRWHQAQDAAPEPMQGCTALVPGSSGVPMGILRTKLHSRMEGRGKASHPKRSVPASPVSLRNCPLCMPRGCPPPASVSA